MHNFKNLRIWNEAMELVTVVYKLTLDFPSEEKFGLTQQIRRSAVSIPSNIAEGASRNTNKEFKYFLGIANGSCAELITQLLICERLGYGNSAAITELTERLEILKGRTSKLQLTFS